MAEFENSEDDYSFDPKDNPGKKASDLKGNSKAGEDKQQK
ncbi:hypothetical protein GCM10007359_19220 [Rothia aerolata]|uniref:Uncharacterized protein n=1 Tax=Rothia aerolata TaxID=1812262 RepID=A0A917MV54_9MICC|nr:hypothetical protein GCM10007359_19220 [Rothia aerolata]